MITSDISIIAKSAQTGLNEAFSVSSQTAQNSAPSTQPPPASYEDPTYGLYLSFGEFRGSAEILTGMQWAAEFAGYTNYTAQWFPFPDNGTTINTNIQYSLPQVTVMNDGSLELSISNGMAYMSCAKVPSSIYFEVTMAGVTANSSLIYVEVCCCQIFKLAQRSYVLFMNQNPAGVAAHINSLQLASYALVFPKLPIPTTEVNDFVTNEESDLLLILNEGALMTELKLPPTVGMFLTNPNLTMIPANGASPGELHLSTFCSCEPNGSPFQPCIQAICPSALELAVRKHRRTRSSAALPSDSMIQISTFASPNCSLGFGATAQVSYFSINQTCSSLSGDLGSMLVSIETQTISVCLDDACQVGCNTSSISLSSITPYVCNSVFSDATGQWLVLSPVSAIPTAFSQIDLSVGEVPLPNDVLFGSVVAQAAAYMASSIFITNVGPPGSCDLVYSSSYDNDSYGYNYIITYSSGNFTYDDFCNSTCQSCSVTLDNIPAGVLVNYTNGTQISIQFSSGFKSIILTEKAPMSTKERNTIIGVIVSLIIVLPLLLFLIYNRRLFYKSLTELMENIVFRIESAAYGSAVAERLMEERRQQKYRRRLVELVSKLYKKAIPTCGYFCSSVLLIVIVEEVALAIWFCVWMKAEPLATYTYQSLQALGIPSSMLNLTTISNFFAPYYHGTIIKVAWGITGFIAFVPALGCIFLERSQTNQSRHYVISFICSQFCWLCIGLFPMLPGLVANFSDVLSFNSSASNSTQRDFVSVVNNLVKYIFAGFTEAYTSDLLLWWVSNSPNAYTLAIAMRTYRLTVCDCYF